MATRSFFSRFHQFAPPTQRRAFVVPALLLPAMAIGQAAALNVLTLPLTRIRGGAFDAGENWTRADTDTLVPTALVSFLLFAIAGARRAEDAAPGPTIALVTLMFGGGMALAAVGAGIHELVVLHLGMVVIGAGLALGLIAVTSSLLAWFPDRSGFASALVVAGIGTGAFIWRTIAVSLLVDESGGRFVVPTLAGFAVASIALLATAALRVRMPDPDWVPPTFTASRRVVIAPEPVAPRVGTPAGRSIAERRPVAPDMPLPAATRTSQFFLLWIAAAAAMFAGTALFGEPSALVLALFPDGINPAGALRFVLLLKAAAVVGGVVWAWLADSLGPRWATGASLALGALFCVILPTAVPRGSVDQFIVACAGIATAGGAVVAILPAAARWLFGPLHAAAIAGRLFSAVAVAALFGPDLFAAFRAELMARGSSLAGAYVSGVYAAAALLGLAALATALLRPLDAPPRQLFGRR